ncbi:AI-2E family transporter [Nannocystaceae bacterium ST9]
MLDLITANKSARIAFGVVLFAAAALLVTVILPIWKPLFMAAVLAAAISPANEWISRKFGNRRKLGTAFTTSLAIVILLIPMVVLGVVIVGEAIDAFEFVRTTLEESGMTGLIARLPDSIEEPLRRVLVMFPTEKSLETATFDGGTAAGLASTVLTGVTAVLFNIGIMLIGFHALLEHGHGLVAWFQRVSPLPETGELLAEARRVSVHVLRSSFLTALIQGVVATIGFAIASVPNPIFFGVLTFFASFIPSVGTGLVSLPLVGLLVLSGFVWQPIFLAVWAIVVLGLVDNMVNPLLIRDGIKLNGILIFFSLVGGMFVFGIIGLLVGPLALAFFLAMIRFAYRDYVEKPKGTIITDGNQVFAGSSLLTVGPRG